MAQQLTAEIVTGTCQNPDCGKEITFRKSAHRKYCDNSCAMKTINAKKKTWQVGESRIRTIDGVKYKATKIAGQRSPKIERLDPYIQNAPAKQAQAQTQVQEQPQKPYVPKAIAAFKAGNKEEMFAGHNLINPSKYIKTHVPEPNTELVPHHLAGIDPRFKNAKVYRLKQTA